MSGSAGSALETVPEVSQAPALISMLAAPNYNHKITEEQRNCVQVQNLVTYSF